MHLQLELAGSQAGRPSHRYRNRYRTLRSTACNWAQSLVDVVRAASVYVQCRAAQMNGDGVGVQNFLMIPEASAMPCLPMSFPWADMNDIRDLLVCEICFARLPLLQGMLLLLNCSFMIQLGIRIFVIMGLFSLEFACCGLRSSDVLPWTSLASPVSIRRVGCVLRCSVRCWLVFRAELLRHVRVRR